MYRTTGAIAGAIGLLVVVVAGVAVSMNQTDESEEVSDEDIVRDLCASRTPNTPYDVTDLIIELDPREHTAKGDTSDHVEELKDRVRTECPDRLALHDAIEQKAERESKRAAEPEGLNDDEPEPTEDSTASGSGDVPESLSELGVTESEWNYFQSVALEANYTFDPSDIETSEGLLLFALDQCDQIATDSTQPFVDDDVSSGADPSDAQSFWSTVESMC